jgi:hypothetical protein
MRVGRKSHERKEKLPARFRCEIIRPKMRFRKAMEVLAPTHEAEFQSLAKSQLTVPRPANETRHFLRSRPVLGSLGSVRT